MQSKWSHLKGRVLESRNAGASMDEIEAHFGVPRATQNSWFSKITLSKNAQDILERKKTTHLVEARKKAVKWHNAEKAKRMESARMAAEGSLSHIDTENKNILELALAMLYLGEGSKTTATGMGNSDPLIVKFFIESIHLLYGIDMARMRFDLHLRADQDPDKMKSLWSDELNVPLDRFKTVSVDKRTLGKKTYETYPGVCAVDCGNVAIQRKLVYLSRTFCRKAVRGIKH